MSYPSPVGGASLILSFRLHRRTAVIIGSNRLAASRAFAALEADSTVLVISNGGEEAACEELRWRAQQKQLSIVDLRALARPSQQDSNGDGDAEALEGYFTSSSDTPVLFVAVTDTLLSGQQRRTRESAASIARMCRRRNILVNVTDYPDLCDFSFNATHRFADPDNHCPTSLQVSVTTNGQGCRLAGRIRREIVTKLPKDVGLAVSRVGQLRSLAKASQALGQIALEAEAELNEEDSIPTPNEPVPQRSPSTHETQDEAARRRMKWVAQVSEYWPLSRLARMTDDDIANVLDGGAALSEHTTDATIVSDNSQHSLPLTPSAPRGRILLVGSGPGHPSLLTIATRDALTKHADLVLSDKLVPAAVLSLIPPHVDVQIARKFPGNADGAQNELMEAGVAAAKRGLTVVRLKQGDPTVYGRAGEEVLYFRAHGFEPVVIPGVSSVLAGPVFAGIPVTQRGAAESFVVCTGVGRQGREVKMPGYERGRTLVVLMGVARLTQLLDTLQSAEPAAGRRGGPAYPACTPIALIERASMPDQRTVFSTLRHIAAAMDSVGEQRPPGMLVIGWSILSLWGEGDVTILNENAETIDEDRVDRWLDGQRWRVVEGLDLGWDKL